MNRLAPIWDALVGSNLWLAIGASMMTSASVFFFTGNWQWNDVEAWVLFATLSLYNWHRLWSPGKQVTNTFPWTQKNPGLVFGLASVSSIVALVLFCFFPLRAQLLLLFPCLLGISYSLPLLPKQKRLRDVPQLKILVLASVWAWIVIYLPLLCLEMPIRPHTILVYLEKWLFFFAIAIAFDIRDVVFDKTRGTLTLPGKFGVNVAKILAQLALVIAIGLSYHLYASSYYSDAVFIGTTFSLLSIGILISFASPQRTSYFYEGLLDGMLILQPLVIWVYS